MTMAACLFERPAILMRDPPEVRCQAARLPGCQFLALLCPCALQWEREYQQYQDMNAELLHQRELYANSEVRVLADLAGFSGGAKGGEAKVCGRLRELAQQSIFPPRQ